ncbi:C-type lectin lectoxin-Thr1-like [Gouania willdenowi]|uniref:C-type lectin lectoxin-Thr1-like n=1 Tax=Gouania willdenowi TaxID=441366 RepID=UPI001054CDEB|nr:C-type lectin lectoxin-Thr1-like [Gouania willdenowi]
MDHYGTLAFILVSGQNQKSFVFHPEKKTWTSAQEYCRKHHTDLATIENSDDNSKATADIPSGSQAWIGLYRIRWRWVDGSQNSFTNWRSGSPDSAIENCAVVDMKHQWNDVQCTQPFIFICQQGKRHML